MSQKNTSPGGRFDVGYIANLARLELGAQEQAQLQSQLEHILTYVEELNQVDVSGVEPMTTASAVETVLRKDAHRPGLDHEAAMANAPAVRQGQFLVPRILE